MMFSNRKDRPNELIRFLVSDRFRTLTFELQEVRTKVHDPWYLVPSALVG